ncbi:MAG: hypothetical protein SOX46_04200 [Clostridiaceae bacterium]|nr:hypothetical protein [Clostridiaceae bacterium]
MNTSLSFALKGAAGYLQRCFVGCGVSRTRYSARVLEPVWRSVLEEAGSVS